MIAHAKLCPPSSAKRWLTCTLSAHLEQQFQNTTTTAADEGTLAHSLAELLIKRKLGRVHKKEFDAALGAIMADPLYDASMRDLMEEYSVFVIEQYNAFLVVSKDAQVYTEIRVDLTKYIPEGFGTNDISIFTENELHIIDLKYGKGVLVECEDNEQMKIYALGILQWAEMLFDIKHVRMTIYQPRMDNISTAQMPAEDLKAWGENYLTPRARMAYNGEGEYQPGSHCKFCKAKPTCRALADQQLQIAYYDFKPPAVLDTTEIADILSKYDSFVDWIGSVYDDALLKALGGAQFPGWKLVEGKSNRAYSNAVAVLEKLKAKGFAEDDIAPRKLLGLTDMQKELGKADFDTYLSELIIKPKGKPTLVTTSDKRQEWDRNAAAADDFKE